MGGGRRGERGLGVKLLRKGEQFWSLGFINYAKYIIWTSLQESMAYKSCATTTPLRAVVAAAVLQSSLAPATWNPASWVQLCSGSPPL